jgi:apolipoprotein N-acyltransferase
VKLRPPKDWTRPGDRGTTGSVPLVMLIDTREPHDDGREPAGEPWIVTLLDWAFPWPALIVWLSVASRYADGWAGVALIYAAVALAAWRALKALPPDGLNENRQ